jgi:drug/metabolite transporter (DMT)-like permease
VGTLLVACFLGRERLDAQKLAALVVSLVGVLCVILPGMSGGSGGSLTGDVLTITNALSYSLFLVLSKPILMRTDPIAATALLLGFGALGIAAIGIPTWTVFDAHALSAEVWGLAAFIIVFSTAGAYLLNSWALARVDSSFVALFIYLQPLVAVALSAVVRAQPPGWRELLGGALIFVGVYLATPRGSLRPVRR